MLATAICAACYVKLSRRRAAAKALRDSEIREQQQLVTQLSEDLAKARTGERLAAAEGRRWEGLYTQLASKIDAQTLELEAKDASIREISTRAMEVMQEDKQSIRHLQVAHTKACKERDSLLRKHATPTVQHTSTVRETLKEVVIEIPAGKSYTSYRASTSTVGTQTSCSSMEEEVRC